MTYPIIQYRLRQDGRIPEDVLAGIATGFSGECSANTNKAGCIPKWIGSQKYQYLGLGIGTESNIQGLPEVVCGVLTTKATLQSYITEISGSWTVKSDVTTGISTYTRTYTTRTVDEMSNPYDPAAKATELWDIYEAVNGL